MKKVSKPITSVIMLVLVAVAVYGLWVAKMGRNEASDAKKEVEKAAITSQDKIIKFETQAVVSLLAELNNKAQKGELTKTQAKKMGADLIRQMRYGNDNKGYFFVDTGAGVNVVLYGNKDVEGKNRIKDSIKGVNYVEEIIKKAKSGGGFTDYWYPKITGGEPMAKRAYSMYFEPFDWSVGTGYYLDEVK